MKLINFIICDDIRREVGNKNSIMEIYEDSINLNVRAEELGKWPKALRISFYIRIRIDTDDEKTKLNKFKLNINYNEKTKTIAEGNLNLDISQIKHGIVLAVVINQFTFENTGTMSASIELIDNTGQVMDSFEIPEKILITENIISI